MKLRELTSNRTAIKTTGGATAVLGWGRGMGHKGHMLLAQAVIHYAHQLKAEPYFVVSRTSVVDPSTGDVWADRAKLNRTKEDPLTPDEKLAIYKKVFPDQSHIFSVATEDATKLEQVMAKLAQQGFKNIVLVVGEDQKNALGYLHKADKSGTSPIQQIGLASLKIISRQDTKAPGSDESKPDYQEGPRATPMRQVLLDPAKTEQDQFAVWRRDMPDNLSDEEVMHLMQTAKARLVKAHTPAVRGKKAQHEIPAAECAGVGTITKQNSTVDVNSSTPKKNLKAFNLVKEANRVIREMRAKEFLSELSNTPGGKMHDQAVDAGQGYTLFRDVGGYDRVYHLNRMMMATAMADGKSNKPVDMPDSSWFEKYNIAFPFTDEEQMMVNQARATIPTDGGELEKRGKSKEPTDTNVVSTVAKPKRNQYGV